MLFHEPSPASDALLRAMQRTMGVPVVDVADAADGKYSDWYELTA